jgi:hypothetical protein
MDRYRQELVNAWNANDTIKYQSAAAMLVKLITQYKCNEGFTKVGAFWTKNPDNFSGRRFGKNKSWKTTTTKKT